MTNCGPEVPHAHVSNGVIGLNVSRSPFLSGEARVAGSYESCEEYDSEALAQVPYPLALCCAVDGRRLSERGAATWSQTYDFACGELRTELVYSVSTGKLVVSDVVFCSRSTPSIVARRLYLRADAPLSVRLDFFIDIEGVRGDFRDAYGEHGDVDWTVLWETVGGRSSLGISFRLDITASRAPVVRRVEEARVRVKSEIDRGGELVVSQLVAMVPDTLHREPHWQALRLVRAATWRGWDDIRENNRYAWNELWRSRVRLMGAGERWQDVADAAFFYLHAAAHDASPYSIPPYGLSSTAYNGHIFWDTETFMLPVLLLTSPKVASNLLRYRAERLPAARANAALSGYGGAMFPWESGSDGCELTPVFAPTSEEHHVSLDVAVACLQYAYVAGDASFVWSVLVPLLRDICCWILSRCVKTERGYEIRHVVGIDEGIVDIDNNAYTNIAAKIVLEGTARLIEGSGLDVDPGALRAVAREMFIPVDAELGVIVKHDRYRYAGGPCNAETLAAFYPLGYRHTDPAVEAATFDYHLGLADTVLHLPMLSPLFGVWAARRGDRGRSLDFFTRGFMDFVCDPFDSFSEWRSETRPLFLTNPAGFLGSCIYGLSGLVPDAGDPQAWGRFPVVLPEGWDAVEVERIWIRGRPASLRACHGAQRASVEWLD